VGEIIKAIVWDIGGVLSRFEDQSWHQKWESYLDLSPGQLEEVIFDNQQSAIATVGQTTPAEVWESVGKRFGLSAEQLATLQVEFWKGSEWDADLFDYIRSSLKGRYKLGVLSDAWLGSRDRVKEWINYDVFDVIMFSAEEGIRKPNPRMYQRMLSRLGVEASEAIFIDDHKDNVEGARAVGMYGIHFTREVDIREAIKEIAG